MLTQMIYERNKLVMEREKEISKNNILKVLQLESRLQHLEKEISDKIYLCII